MAHIECLTIHGYKSIQKLEEFRPNKSVNLFPGSNGAWKTNLISFFRMLFSCLEFLNQDKVWLLLVKLRDIRTGLVFVS